MKAPANTSAPPAEAGGRRFVSWWDEALSVLGRRPELADLVELVRRQGEGLYASDDLMRSILRAVCGQQVSNAAGMKLSGTVLAACGGARGHALSEVLLARGADGLRALGLSRAKSLALTALAGQFSQGRIDEAACAACDDAEIESRLTALYGVGPWTAHMVLIFGLGRPNVWPGGDFGIRKALRQRALPEGPHEEFSPWRTAAAWLLWRSLTQTPVQY